MRLNHVTLLVSDVEASVDFYRRLGLTQIVANYPDYARFVLPEGDATLSVYRVGRSPSDPSVNLHFEVDDVGATVRELERAGFEFACPPVDQPFLWREAILVDPDGHRIFIYHAGENRLNPPWRIDTSASGS